MDPDSSLDRFRLNPPERSRPALDFRVVRDDLTRGALYLHGKADAMYDTLSLSKTDHFRQKGETVITAPGSHLSYLGFNLKSPILGILAIRRAISMGLPVSLWVKSKYFSFAEELGAGAPTFHPEESARLLDQAGFPRGPDGIRFHLRYLTTPVREGSELALLVREALTKLGIQIEIVPLEPSLFFSRLKGGDFDLFASRIFRSAGEDPSLELLRTGSPRNYFSYSNATLDSLGNGGKTPGLPELLPFILQDLPWIPLFTWRHALLLSKRVEGAGDPLDPGEDSFRFLRKLRIK